MSQIRKDMTIFNDSVHGSIEIDTRLVKYLIDTPEFQRLRRIKQIGGVCYVFPGAQHSRFEHSIGTAFLAGKLARHLQKIHSDEDLISEVDIICLEVAGLCHDLGHGPFSHLFDNKFMKAIRGEDPDNAWTHEQGSVDILTSILNKEVREGLGLEEIDVKLIQKMINPKGFSNNDALESRIKGKGFLCEFVSNSETGVDVDKWDYFARDCLHLGIRNSFDHNRFIHCTRLIKDEKDGEFHICIRDKGVLDLYEMFHTRFMLHRRAIQHKSANAVEHMICDAMLLANDVVKICSENGSAPCSISDCTKDLKAFRNLDDSILQTIAMWQTDDPKLKQAKSLLKRLENGKRYKCVGSELLGIHADKMTTDDIVSALEEQNETLKGKLRASIITFGYGSGVKNPVDRCMFYTKQERQKLISISKQYVSYFLPDIFEERGIQVFCASEDKKVVGDAAKAFDMWYAEYKPRTVDKIRLICENMKREGDCAEKADEVLHVLDRS